MKCQLLRFVMNVMQKQELVTVTIGKKKPNKTKFSFERRMDMTVSELIEKLQELDGDKKVYIFDKASEWGSTELEKIDDEYGNIYLVG